MNREEIAQLLHANLDATQRNLCQIEYVGFPDDQQRGWFCHATGAETRAQSEERATKFYLWLCHKLDGDLSDNNVPDIFDAGVRVEGEEEENDFDRFQKRLRRRRMYLLVGHGDFMSLVLKRVMSGFGHSIEIEGIPHRSAFVHNNTGMTDCAYRQEMSRDIRPRKPVTNHFSFSFVDWQWNTLELVVF
jgi:hypothetical protein